MVRIHVGPPVRSRKSALRRAFSWSLLGIASATVGMLRRKMLQALDLAELLAETYSDEANGDRQNVRDLQPLELACLQLSYLRPN